MYSDNFVVFVLEFIVVGKTDPSILFQGTRPKVQLRGRPLQMTPSDAIGSNFKTLLN